MNRRTLTMTNLLNLTHTTANHISPQLLGTRSRRLCPRAVQQATAVLAAEIGCHTFRATGITASNLAG
jgi:hypothetical protein